MIPIDLMGSWQTLPRLDVFTGVRPSPGAESEGLTTASVTSIACCHSGLAAAEDGRTPLSPYPPLGGRSSVWPSPVTRSVGRFLELSQRLDLRRRSGREFAELRDLFG